MLIISSVLIRVLEHPAAGVSDMCVAESRRLHPSERPLAVSSDSHTVEMR